MIYGYARVSTAKQMLNGNSVADQENALRKAGAEIIVADDYTGTSMDRPEFTKLRSTLQAGDTLIVTKLDRFARTVVEGVTVIQELIDRGVCVQILNMGTVENTATGKVLLSILLAFAQYERDMIIERTQAGKAIARANGRRVDGRPNKFTEAQMSHALDLIHGGHSYTDVVNLTGISKSTIIRAERRWKAEHTDTV